MADGSEQLRQEDIESLLKQAKASANKPPAAAPPPPPPAAAPPDPGGNLGQAEIEALLNPRAAAAPPQKASSETGPLGQADVESLFAQSAKPRPQARPAAAVASAPPQPRSVPQARSVPELEGLPSGDVELLLKHAEEALASVASGLGGAPALPQGAAVFHLQDFAGTPPSASEATLDLIRDVELDLRIELGRTHMHLDEVLRLRKGAVVALDRLAGDPVDIFVNGRLIARGEVLVLNDNFCVRVAELVAGERVA